MDELALLPLHSTSITAVAFGPLSTILTASAAGDVLLRSASPSTPLAALATLRPPGGASIQTLDVLPPLDKLHAATTVGVWAFANAKQQVRLWVPRA